MKLNRKWLNEEFVDLSGVPDREFVETMTIAGQKVETYERLDAELRNVVVGRVVSITRHTNSDHMCVCQIDVGAGEPVQIVTGAWNIHVGVYVPAALHGAHGEKRQDRSVSALDAREIAQQRRAPHQQHRRYHELCDARIRPADARL